MKEITIGEFGEALNTFLIVGESNVEFHEFIMDEMKLSKSEINNLILNLMGSKTKLKI